MTTCAENSSFGLFLKHLTNKTVLLKFACMFFIHMNLSLPHMRTRTLCAVSKSTDGLNNDGCQHCLWGFDFHHTAHMNKSFKASLPSLLFHLRGQKTAEVAWRLSSLVDYESLNTRSN